MSTTSEIQAAFQRAGEAMRISLDEMRDAIDRLSDAMITYAADRAVWQAQRYGAAQQRYGVRRVTARQYRAWKRREGRR